MVATETRRKAPRREISPVHVASGSSHEPNGRMTLFPPPYTSVWETFWVTPVETVVLGRAAKRAGVRRGHGSRTGFREDPHRGDRPYLTKVEGTSQAMEVFDRVLDRVRYQVHEPNTFGERVFAGIVRTLDRVDNATKSPRRALIAAFI